MWPCSEALVRACWVISYSGFELKVPGMLSNEHKALRTGQCLCGSVRYAVSGALRPVVMCHCNQCRHTTGHFMAATAARRSDFQLTANGELKWYEASDRARRGFCARCGATMFWDGRQRDFISIAAGTLDKPTGLATACHIFVADKGDYYTIDDGLPQAVDGTYLAPFPEI